ncbi:hypothetical protein K2Z84_27955 [Candidatus Binatia bacterium]|nr:hypothetical protein [Candidatus Binatia bacterium]
MSKHHDDTRSRARREIDLGKEVYETFLDSFAELLSLRVTAREAGQQLRDALDDALNGEGMTPRLPKASELRDLAFDLAQLQVQNLRELTRIGRNHTRFLADKLAARREVAEDHATSASRRQILVRPRLDRDGRRLVDTLHLVNATSARGTVVLPRVLTFRSADGRHSFFVQASFSPDHPTLAPGAEVHVQMALDADQFRGGGTFLAEATIALGTERTIDLFVQVDLPAAFA